MINIYGVLEDSEQPTSTCFSESICLEPKANQIAETVSNMSSVHSLDTDANAEIVYNCLSSVLDNKCDFLYDQTASSSLTSAVTNNIELCAQQASVCVENLDDGHVQVQGKYDSVSFNRVLTVQPSVKILTQNLLEQDQDGDTILHRAMIDEDWSLVHALLKQYETDGILTDVIYLENNYKQTLLCLAVILNQPDLVETLIKHGADANIQIRKMQSDTKMGVKFDHPVHFSVCKGQLWFKTLAILLKSEHINMNSFNSEGRSAPHCAIDAHRKDVDGSTCEQSCRQIDSKPILTLLAEAGADINLPDTASEETPLHYAIRRKHLDLVARLLTLAANSPNQQLNSVCKLLESKTGSGNSALHLAAMTTMDIKDQKKLVQMLLSRGADPSCKNDEGHLPREVAKNAEIVELLKGKNSTRVSYLCSSTALAK
jgi:ankyrin repeat protein